MERKTIFEMRATDRCQGAQFSLSHFDEKFWHMSAKIAVREGRWRKPISSITRDPRNQH